jgi:hypothetical protein
MTQFFSVLLDERTREGRQLWRIAQPLQYCVGWSELPDVLITVREGIVTDMRLDQGIPGFCQSPTIQ